MDEVCKRHLATIRKFSLWVARLLGYSLGGVVAQRDRRATSSKKATPSNPGLLDTYPPEIQDWSRPPTEDEEREIEKERALFMNASKDALDSALAKEKAEMFGNIMKNYEDSVRPLHCEDGALSRSATLFVARRTFGLPGMDVQETWRPYVGQLNVVDLDCAHGHCLSALLAGFGTNSQWLAEKTERRGARGWTLSTPQKRRKRRATKAMPCRRVHL
jgi:thioesterase domain-containing protein